MKQFLPGLTGILGVICMSFSGGSVEFNRTFKGEIKEGTGRPVGNALVLIHSADEVKMARSDSQGQFEFRSLPAGVYGLEVTASGFQDNSVNSISLPAKEHPLIITMAVANTTSHCGHDLVSYEQVAGGHRGAISGSVVDNYVAIASVKIQLFRIGEPVVIAMQRTDKKGKFEFRDLAPGQYAVRLSHNHYPGHQSDKFWIGPEIHTRLSTAMVPKGSMIACQ